MQKLIITFLFSILLFSCGRDKEELAVKTEKISGAELKSTFKVWGNCETCKDAIENSLRIDGITTADWNMETKLIAVTYDSTKINLDKIEQKIAAAGYDNIKYKGNDAAYENLPQCCKYDRK
ncbi:MAG TPA: heavy-metal-associated domain-containing protein [Bacteroidia bacterium]|jgi:mercuric ion binding protein|nr:heavy-metal-associated domain-containing protein [Bacteroidia bacterium]